MEWWVVTSSCLWAGNFVAPAEGPVAFRRDKIPLDSDAMAGISRQMVALARGLDGETAASRRSAAQMLALAIALDPGNNQARSVISEFESGKHRRETDTEQLHKSLDRVRNYLAWLESPEAGSQGQALAACLADVVLVSNPNQSSVQAERGAWKTWIADVTAFEPPPAPEMPTQADAVPDTSGVPQSGFLLEKAQVFTVTWTRTGTEAAGGWKQKISPLQMVAKPPKSKHEKPMPFSISIGPNSEEGAFRELGQTLTRLLQSRHGTLPAGGQVLINGPDLGLQLVPQRRQSISAAAAVLADAAISGREPDAVILGVVDESGAFELPTRFWDQLLALGPGDGGRLILPTAAAGYLPSLLALEKPQVFFDYEIMLAANFEQLLAFSAKNPDDAVVKSMASFREIREKAGTQPIGPYLANVFVRRRLVDLVQTDPAHFSAKMLAIQGAGNRPVHLTRNILASELRLAIEPMEWLMKAKANNLDPEELGRLGDTYEICRAQVDRLIRYASKEDRPMLDRVQDMVTGIRSMDRTARTGGYSYDIHTEIHLSHTKLAGAYQAAVAEIAAASGEAAPPPLD